MQHPIIVGSLVVIAVVLCCLCALGLAIARDPFQRLQFCTPVASLAGPLIAAAIWVADPSWQSRVKATLVAAVIILTNAVLGHATARAVRIRDAGQWPPPEEQAGAAEEAQGATGDSGRPGGGTD